MHVKAIQYHLGIIRRVRARLGDMTSPRDRIILKPGGDPLDLEILERQEKKLTILLRMVD